MNVNNKIAKTSNMQQQVWNIDIFVYSGPGLRLEQESSCDKCAVVVDTRLRCDYYSSSTNGGSKYRLLSRDACQLLHCPTARTATICVRTRKTENANVPIAAYVYFGN